MPRPLTRAQALENAAFLRALRRTGNVRDAARRLGVHRAKFTRRRAAHPAFAAEWDAALAFAHARLHARAGQGVGQGSGQGAGQGSDRTRPAAEAEPRAVATRDGRVQLRRTGGGRMTRADEQAFLMALSATANIRLAAQAAGFSHAAFYRRRQQHAGFDREWRLALERGYERVEMALIEATLPGAHRDDAWRHNDPLPIPPMTANQALQLLYLHQKEARLQAEPAHLKRRRGESPEVHSYRLSVMYRLTLERQREEYAIAQAARLAGQASPHELPPPVLPDLAQVTGWSRATGAGEGSDRALFGGWRLGD